MKIRPVSKMRLGALLFGVLLAQAAHAVPVVSALVTPGTATVGSTVSVAINMAGAVDVYAYQFSLAFNPSVLQVASITEGPFFKSAGSTFWDGGSVDNVGGTILGGFDSLIGSGPGVSGSGVLERIVFTVKGAGTSAIAFSDLLVLNSASADLGATATPGSVVAVVGAVPEPASAALLGLGLGALGWARARGARRPAASIPAA